MSRYDSSLGKSPGSFLPALRMAGGISLLLLMFGDGCNSTRFTSRWRDRDITVDGSLKEWGESLMQIEDTPSMVGFMNDSAYLYCAFVTSDHALQRQIAYRGLKVWFDAKGDDGKTFGILFPLGAASPQPPPTDGEWNSDPEEAIREHLSAESNEAEILGPSDQTPRRVNLLQSKTIALKMTLANGNLSYELKIPLSVMGADDDYAIGTSAGATIGIGLETAPRSEHPEGESRPEGGGGVPSGGTGGGHGGGRGGGHRGGGGGSSRGSSTGQSKPLDVWAKVQLVTLSKAIH